MSLHHLHNWARSLTNHSIHPRPLDVKIAKQWMSRTGDIHLTKWANQVRNHKIKKIELEQEWRWFLTCDVHYGPIYYIQSRIAMLFLYTTCK